MKCKSSYSPFHKIFLLKYDIILDYQFILILPKMWLISFQEGYKCKALGVSCLTWCNKSLSSVDWKICM